MGSKSSNPSTSTTTTSIPQVVLDNYNQLTAAAKNVAQTPYQGYTGQMVAGMSGTQNQAIGNINAAQGIDQPYMQQAQQQIAGANPSAWLGAAAGAGAAGNPSAYIGAAGSATGQAMPTAGLAAAYGAAGSAYPGANINAANGAAGQAMPMGFLGAGAYSAGQAGAQIAPKQFTDAELAKYYNPFQSRVIDATMANINQTNAQQQQQVIGGAIQKGAFGGDRSGIVQAELARQQGLAANQTLAGLQQAGYQNAQDMFNTQQGVDMTAQQQTAQNAATAAGLYGTLGGLQSQAALGQAGAFTQAGQLASQSALGQANAFNQSAQTQSQAALGQANAFLGQGQLQAQYGNQLGQLLAGLGQTQSNYGLQSGQTLGQLGSAASQNALAQSNAQMQAGAVQQQQQQNELSAAYQLWQNAQAYPFQTTGWLSNIVSGLGSQGGTSSTISQSPAQSSAGTYLGAGLAALGALSDKRAKENVQGIGQTYDGQKIYRYNYKGEAATRIGLMAQEVEKKTPDAVGEIGKGGLKFIDYKEATDKAASRGGFARGGSMPYGASIDFTRGGPFDTEGGSGPYGADTGPYGTASSMDKARPNKFGEIPDSSGGTKSEGEPGDGGAGSSSIIPTSAGAEVAKTAPNGAQDQSAWTQATGLPGLDLGGSDVRQSLMAAGLGMMASKSQHAGQQIGEGGLAGMQQYSKQREMQRQRDLADATIANQKADVALRSRGLDQQQEVQRAQIEQTKAEARLREQQLDLTRWDSRPGLTGVMYIDKLGKLPTRMVPYGQTGPDGQTVEGPSTAPPASPGTGGDGGAGAGQPSPSPAPAPKVQTYIDPQTGRMVESETPLVTSKGEQVPPTAPKPITLGGPVPQPRKYPTNQLQWSPEGQKLIAADTQAIRETSRKAYESAQQQKQQLDIMEHAFDEVNSTDWYRTGPTNETRVKVAKTVNDIAGALGIKTTINESAIASTEEINKVAFRMGAELSRTTGSDVAASIVQQSVGAVPSAANTPVGAKRLVAGVRAASQRQIDLHEFREEWMKNNGGDMTQADAYFNKVRPPESYVKQAVASTIPRGAIELLRSDPKMADAFDQKYGKGSARIVLGQ